MAIDRKHVGYAFPDFSVTVDPARLQAFAQAIGECSPTYAQELAPPTFMKVIEGEHGSSRAILDALGVDLRRVLHAEQQFEYALPITAGEPLQVRRTVTDIYDKKGGAMEFIVIESVLHNRAGALVGRSRQVVLVRNPTPSTAP